MAIAAATSACTLSSAFVGQSLDATRLKSKAVPITGLPVLSRCHITNLAERQEVKANGGGQQIALACALAAAVSQGGSAMALVDERLSTEGTGLGLGVSNPLLIWILLGVFTLVWALFFVYSSSLPAGDDDSGLSL